MLAERAWSYAMQLRVEANTEPRKKFHLVSRLRKAASYAIQLQKLCEVKLLYYYVQISIRCDIFIFFKIMCKSCSKNIKFIFIFNFLIYNLF